MPHNVIRRLRDNQAGFTLIELLVVITILGILAAVVVFAVGGIGDKGQDSACRTNLTTIQTAQEAYFARPTGGGTYAADNTALRNANLLSGGDVDKLHRSSGNATGYTISPAPGSPCTNSLP